MAWPTQVHSPCSSVNGEFMSDDDLSSFGLGWIVSPDNRERTLDATALSEYLQNHPIDYLDRPSHLQALMYQGRSAHINAERCLIIGVRLPIGV